MKPTIKSMKKMRFVSVQMVVFAVVVMFEYVAWGEDWHCRNGQTYENVRYMRHNRSAVQFSHSSGISIEQFTNLPDDIQARYGYDPQKEEEARLEHQKQWKERQEEIQKRKKYECIEVQTNEFQNRVTVSLKSGALELEQKSSLVASVLFIEGVDDIRFGFVSKRPSSLGWRFLQSHQVYFLIDGDRWHPMEDYDSDILTDSNSLFELIGFSIPVERMESIIKAQSVKFQIGGEEFKFSQDHKTKMGIFLEYLRENYNMDEIIQNQKKMLEFIQKTQKVKEFLFL